MRKPFMLISVLPITVHISHDTDTGSNRIGGIPEKYAFKNKVLRSICFVLFLLSIGLNSAFAQVRNAAGLVVDENGQPFTAHTTNPVPFCIVGAAVRLRDGRLADIAPTMLDLMGLNQPEEMDGKTLIIN